MEHKLRLIGIKAVLYRIIKQFILEDNQYKNTAIVK